MRKLVLFALMVFVFGLLAACQQVETPAAMPTPIPGPTPVPLQGASELVGVWYGPGVDGMYQRFDPDGSCRAAYLLENLEVAPNVMCTYAYADGVLTYTVVKSMDVPDCPQDTGIYAAAMSGDGYLYFTVIEDNCRTRITTMSRKYEAVQE